MPDTESDRIGNLDPEGIRPPGAPRGSGDLLADRRYAYAEACLADGAARAAAEMAEQALEIAPRYAPAWVLLGRAREALHAAGGDPALREAAIRAYAAARDFDPEGVLGVQVHLARLGAGAGLPALSPAYVRALFDGYAPRFERHLVEGLGYRGPALIRDALERAPGAPAHFTHLVDLGCGTGLVGAALAGRAERITGVDLSPAMLALARRGGLYHRLEQGEIGAFLAAEPPGSADLCTAADVLIYLADLGPALAGVARLLAPGGLAALTVQSPGDGAAGGDGTGGENGTDPVLGPDGRYAHPDGHLRAAAAAAGLGIVLLEPAAVRRERGRDVPGRLAVLAHGPEDAPGAG